MRGDFDFGRLTQAVESLTDKVQQLEATVSSINDRMNRGQGFAWGLMFAAGGVGAAVTTAISKLFGK